MRSLVAAPSAFAFVALVFATLANGCAAKTSLSYACPAIVGLPPKLVLPAPNATGVPTSVGVLVLGGGPTDGTFLLAGPTFSFAVGPAGAVPSPAPNGIPTYQPLSDFRAIPVPTLAAQTAYTLSYVANPGTGPCGSGESSGLVGTFTTQ